MKKSVLGRAPKNQSRNVEAVRFHMGWLGIGLIVMSLLAQSMGLAVVPSAQASNGSVAGGATAGQTDTPAALPSTLHPLGDLSDSVPFWQELAQREQGQLAASRLPLTGNAAAILAGLGGGNSDVASSAVRPNIAFAHTYYANYVTDDAGTATSAVCTNSANPNTSAGCSLRSAINRAAADAHGTSPDLILLKHGTYAVNITANGQLPAVADYVYVSATSDLSCSTLSNGAAVAANNLVAGTAGLQLGNHDYVNEVVVESFGDGIRINGANNTVTCVAVVDDYNGIVVSTGASNNQIGGVFGNTSSFFTNGFEVVTDITLNGIVISGTNTTVQNTLNTYSLQTGILIGGGATNNTIGSAAATQTNDIVGNIGNGVVITGTGTTGNKLFGNHIGVDITGTKAISNTLDGVLIGGGASGNQIGGSAAGQGNLVSGNGYSGIVVNGSSNNNIIQGNLIGVKGDLSGPLYNGTSAGTSGSVCHDTGAATPSQDCAGILVVSDGTVGPTGTQIGGNFNTGQGNLVASDNFGIELDFANANTVQGNSIGARVTASGYISYPTSIGVVLLNSASNNQIGGDSSLGQGNFVVGNSFGILADSVAFGSGSGSGTNGNKIQGNAVGVNFSGNPTSSIIGEFGIGLLSEFITSSVSSNLVGVDLSATTPNQNQANLIGNYLIGVAVGDPGTASNQVNGNKIGVNQAGNTSTTGNDYGIYLSSGATNTRVQNNIIGAANLTTTVGIFLAGPITNTLITKNYIGTNANGADLHNSTGISLTNNLPGGPNGTVINQNTIGFNQGDGIAVGKDATDNFTQRNTISQNSIFRNTGLGINLHYATANPNGLSGGAATGPNNQAARPTLTSATIGVNSGVQAAGTASPNSTVEVFLGDSTGITTTQGRTYLGIATANSSGNFALNAPSPAGVTIPNPAFLVATDTLNDPAFPTRVGSTSQFSAPIAATVITAYIYNLPLLANNADTPVGHITTFITFQNLSASAAATINVQYYAIGNGTAGPAENPISVPAKGQTAISSAIPPGSSYGGIVTSSQPLNLVVSEALNAGGSAYNVAATTASTLYSPLALNGQYGFTTSMIVFNAASTGTATGQIQFYDETGAAIQNATQTLNIPAHASQTFNQAAGGSGLNANHPYWARIVGAAGSQLTAQVIEFGPANFVATFNAIAPAQVQSTLYAPAVFNGQFNFVTGIALANPSGAVANLTISYYNAAGTQRLQTIKTIPANGVIGVFQPNETGLPSDVTSAVVSSNQPLISTVNEKGPGTISGTYVGLASGSTNVALPVMAKGFASFVTGATVLNTGSSPAMLAFTYYDQSGTQVGPTQNQTIAPYASFLVYQGDAAQALPSGFFGTAIITSNQPLLVTTNALQTGTGLFYTYTEPSS